MGVINIMKNSLGIGECQLAKINRVIRELKLIYPPDIEDKWRKAEAVMKQINFDKSFRSDELSLEERTLNIQLETEAMAILQLKQNYDDNFQAKKQELKKQKREIEGNILRWRIRRKFLLDDFQGKHEQELADLNRALRWSKYTLERDQKAFLAEKQALDAELRELQEQQENILDMDLEMRLNDIELRKQHFVKQRFPAMKSEFETREAEIKELERRIKICETNYKEALEQCNDELRNLAGE